MKYEKQKQENNALEVKLPHLKYEFCTKYFAFLCEKTK